MSALFRSGLDASFWSRWVKCGPAGASISADALYEEATALFEAGLFVQAARVFARYLKSIKRSDLLSEKKMTWLGFDCLTFEKFERHFLAFLDEQNSTRLQGRCPLPAFLQENPSRPDERLNARMRVLFLFPEFINTSKKYIECNFKDFFFQSAINAGIESDYFFTDKISYPDFDFEPELAGRDLLVLREKVASMRPDVIFFDANYLGGEGGFNLDYFTKLKAEFHFRTIGYLGDAWGDYWAAIADYWGSVTDVMMHVAPGGGAEKNSKNPNVLFCSPCPLNRLNFYPADKFSYDISFVGSYASYLRPFWLTHATIEAQRLKLRHHLRAHQRTNEGPTMLEYGKIMRESRMVLNFSSRQSHSKAMTGRPWEAMNSGILLLEEDNEPIKHFFVPFIHYVPFKNVEQLCYLIRFFVRHPEMARRIGRSAAAFCDEHYSAASIWGRLFDRVVSKTWSLRGG